MKPINIIIYLVMIAVFEGALHEYMWSTTAHSRRGSVRIVKPNRVSKEPKKELVATVLSLGRVEHGWYEILIVIVQSLWALLGSLARWIWHEIREWIELLLMAFELSELVHKITGRLSWWEGPYS